MILGGVVVAAALVALVIALSGGSDGPLSLGDDTPETPEFAFKASKPIVITTAANPQPEAPPATPTPSQDRQEEGVDRCPAGGGRSGRNPGRLLHGRVLGPGNWQDAAYEEVFDSFTNQAREEAE